MNDLRTEITRVRDAYRGQMKFCDIEAFGYFREFVRRLDDALAAADLNLQGHRADCAIRLPHPASICTCHIADKQRAETFANGLRDDDGCCSHCDAPLFPSERCWCWERPASCGTRPKGGDAHAAPALPSDAVSEAQTPNLSRPIPDTLNAGGCE